jgi:Ig-like domain from next to BRCA1 gene
MKKLNLLKEKIMVTKQTTLQAFRKSLLVTLALITLLAACAPAQPSQGQVQSLVQTSVASTMQAQNQVGTFVAQTVQAYQPAATETQQSVATDTPTVETTETPLVTLTPILLETPTTAPSSGGGGGYVYVPPQPYSCDPDIDKRPLDSNPPYAPGDHFEIKWKLLNNGTHDWPAGYYVDWYSVASNLIPQPDPSTLPQISVQTGPIYLPEVDSNHTYQLPTLEGIAPNQPGRYTLTWKLHGFSQCYLYIAITVK